LLLYILQDLVRQAMRIMTGTTVDEEQQQKRTLQISLGDFEHRARQVNIHDVTPFFSSRYFVANGFRLDERQIVKDL
jgi:hypothetical protein